MLPAVLASLGVPTDEFSLRVAWAVRAMDARFTPYAAAQKLLEYVDNQESPPLMLTAVRDVAAAVEASDGFSDDGAGRVRAALLALAEARGVGL